MQHSYNEISSCFQMLLDIKNRNDSDYVLEVVLYTRLKYQNTGMNNQELNRTITSIVIMLKYSMIFYVKMFLFICLV